MRYLLIVLLAFLGTGCATMQNSADPAKVATDVPAGSGIMLMSAGAPERCMAMGTFLNLYREDGAGGVKSLRLLAVDAYVLKSDFPGHQGNVHALVLEEGSYILKPSIANPYFTPTEVPQVRFTITPGTIVYIGEYFLTRSCSTLTYAEIRDQSTRDLAIATFKNPSLAKFPVVVRLATFLPKPQKE